MRMRYRLALDPLRALTGFVAAVLLAFDHAAVAGEQACFFQRVAQGRLKMHERARNAVAHRAGLAGEATAGDDAGDVKLADASGHFERMVDDQALRAAREILHDIAAVDDDL